LIARFQKFNDQIENGRFHRTNGTVLRSCSSPSSSGAVSGNNGFEAVSNGWYSLAIKPEKMRERRGEEEAKGEESQGGEKATNERKRKTGGREEKNKSRTGKKQNRGRAKFVPLFLLKETEALGAVPW
jgi:hypothetical protein